MVFGWEEIGGDLGTQRGDELSSKQPEVVSGDAWELELNPGHTSAPCLLWSSEVKQTDILKS